MPLFMSDSALCTAVAPCLQPVTAGHVECEFGLAAGVVVGANSRVAAVAFEAIASDAGYVRPNGRRFSYAGKDFWRECAAQDHHGRIAKDATLCLSGSGLE
jgi:hypothetical protein